MKLARTKEWRESCGLTQRGLAAEAGVGEVTVARIETGASVTPPTARKIAGALGVSVADLLEHPPVPLAGASSESTSPEETTGVDLDLMEEPVPFEEAPRGAGPSARAEQLWREPTEPEFSEEEITRMVEGLRKSVKHPEAVRLIESLEAVAEHVEYVLQRGCYDLGEVWHLNETARSVYADYRARRKRLLESLRDSSPQLHELLQQADARIKAARNAAGEAHEACRLAEQDTDKVTRIGKLEEARQRKQAERKRLAETGA